jgi:transglutaminase/protease-like cytokinesis protein 3
LIVFTNSFFANNRNMSSQIDYVIYLVEFDSRLKTNVIHWLSIKFKRIIRSVLAAKLYAMTHDFDLDATLKEIVSNILDIFISLVLYIDSKSLYNCLVRLDTIQKKRLMIDVMSLR